MSAPQYLDLPIDYESLTKVGSMMGSGGMIVMDEKTCMVDIARFFLSFTQDESCGKCTPCRLGTQRMLETLTRITQGQGREGDIELLLEMGKGIKDASLCGLGQTCPNPVLSTIAHFRSEYEAHIGGNIVRPEPAKPWSSPPAKTPARFAATLSAMPRSSRRAVMKRLCPSSA